MKTEDSNIGMGGGCTLHTLEKELEDMREFLTGNTEPFRERYSTMDVPTFHEISEMTDIPIEEIVQKIVSVPMPVVVDWLLSRVRMRMRSEKIGI